MSFTAEQIAQLLQPIKPERVLRDNSGMSHVSQQDVTAHLSRIFGFGGWDKEILDLRCVRDEMVVVPAKNGKPERQVPSVTYLCRLRLTVRDPDGNVMKVSEDVGTGTSPNLPTHGDAHDFAAKNAVSYALKRCAKDLGDQFGLSLYNKGQMSALVRGTLVMPEGQHEGDVQEGVEQQVSDGEHVAPESEPQQQSHPPATQTPPGEPRGDLTPKQKLWRFAQSVGMSAEQLGNGFTDWSGSEGKPLNQAATERILDYLALLQTAFEQEPGEAA